MAKSLSQSETDALENLIDKASLRAVLEMIAVISSEKAQHIETNWQDENLAKAWYRASNKIYLFAEHCV